MAIASYPDVQPAHDTTALRVPLRRVTALYRINELLAQARTEAEALQIAADGLVSEAGYVNSWMATVDHAAQKLQSRTGAGAGWHPSLTTMAIPLDAPSAATQVARSGQADISMEAVAQADRDGWGDLARQSGLHSAAYVPLTQGSQVIGVISVGFLKLMHVEEETTLLNLFASQLVGALQRIKLDTERANQITALEAAAVVQERLLETVRELSTPAIPIYDGILVLPLVGNIDSTRAAQMMEITLTSVARERAAVIILDVTGVPVIDTGVANCLVQVTQAAQLLGARAMLVGIKPEVAQTLVQLGVDLGAMTTRSNLQAGVAFALQTLGLRIVDTNN